MPLKRKMWPLLLLLLFLIPFVFWRAATRRSDQLTGQTETPAPSQHVPEQENFTPDGRRGPVYVPAVRAQLEGYKRPTEYFLAGRVTSEQGDALPGAIVSLHETGMSRITYDWPSPFLYQICDNEGRYAIRLNSPVHAFIVASKQGYAQREEEIEILEPGTIMKNYQLRAAPACAEGSVRSKQGEPIAGAVVYAGVGIPWLARSSSSFSLIVTTTDSSGKYVLNQIPMDIASIGAASHSHKEEVKMVDDDLKIGDCKHFDFDLESALEISFIVKNTRGEVIAHAGSLNNGSGMVMLHVPPDKPPFEYTVRARGYMAKPILVDPKAPPSSVILEDGPPLRGHVMSESGEPIIGAKVHIDGSGVTATDGTGRFSLPVPSASDIRITANKEGFLERRVGYSYKDAPPEIEIRLKQSEGGIYGRVIDSKGTHVSKFRLSIQSPTTESLIHYLQEFESDNGTFSITDLPPGTYDIEVEIQPDSDSPSRQFMRVNKVEIRKGYFYGEILFQFPPPIDEKKNKSIR